VRSFFLTTARLGFSVWSPADLPLARQLWGDPQVTHYICASGVFSEAEIENRLASEIEHYQEYAIQYWPIFHLQTGDLVGCCGLRPFEPENDGYELGFHLRPQFWGQRYAFEAASAVLDYAFMTLYARQIVAGHHPQNAASQKVLERLGFTFVRLVFYPPTGLMHPSYALNAVS
jgi:RimJ/RimL family protein N-acetyltransferase